MKTLWKETLILKMGFMVVFTLLGSVGLVPIIAGFVAGTAILEPVVVQGVEVRPQMLVITNAPAIFAGLAIGAAITKGAPRYFYFNDETKRILEDALD